MTKTHFSAGCSPFRSAVMQVPWCVGLMQFEDVLDADTELSGDRKRTHEALRASGRSERQQERKIAPSQIPQTSRHPQNQSCISRFLS